MNTTTPARTLDLARRYPVVAVRPRCARPRDGPQAGRCRMLAERYRKARHRKLVSHWIWWIPSARVTSRDVAAFCYSSEQAFQTTDPDPGLRQYGQLVAVIDGLGQEMQVTAWITRATITGPTAGAFNKDIKRAEALTSRWTDVRVTVEDTGWHHLAGVSG